MLTRSIKYVFIDLHYDNSTLSGLNALNDFFEDSFFSLAMRVYETEIEMLVNTIHLIENNLAILTSLSDKTFTANMRMPHHYEIIMIEKFNELRKNSLSIRDI